MDALKKKKIVNGLVVVLAIGFALSFANSIRRIRAKLSGGASIVRVALPVQDLSFLVQIRASDVIRKKQEEAWTRSWGRDPFAAEGPEVNGSGSSASDLHVSGIVWDEVMPVAIINEKVLKVGDEIHGFSIDKITQRSVYVRGEEGILELPLFQNKLPSDTANEKQKSR